MVLPVAAGECLCRGDLALPPSRECTFCSSTQTANSKVIFGIDGCLSPDGCRLSAVPAGGGLGCGDGSGSIPAGVRLAPAAAVVLVPAAAVTLVPAAAVTLVQAMVCGKVITGDRS